MDVLKKYYSHAKNLRDISMEQLEAQASHLPVTIFNRCKYVVGEIHRVEIACEALKNNDLTTLGQLMYETHHGLQYDYEVSCPELDFLVDLTTSFNRISGVPQAVLGARMMGGGFGGCSINLVKKATLPGFIDYMQSNFKAKYHRELPCHEVTLTDGVTAFSEQHHL